MSRRLAATLVALVMPFLFSSVAQAATNDVVGSISVGSGPLGMCSDTSNAYALNWSADTISQIDATSMSVTRVLTGFHHPRDCAVDNGVLYVVNQTSDSLAVVDLTTGNITSTIAVGAQPLSVTKYGGSLYVANYSADSISIIDIASASVSFTIALVANSGPSDIATSGTNLIVSLFGPSGSGGFSVIDGATNSVSRTVSGSVALKVAVGNGLILLASPSANSVTAYSASTFAQVWVAGSLASASDVLSVGDSVYTSVRNADQVAQISNGSTLASIPVAGHPWGLALVGNSLFVAANSANQVAVISVNALGSPASGTDAPSPVLQQVGLAPGASCRAITDPSLNWGGSSSGGWGQSWAQWANGGLGGDVCTRTLFYFELLGHWEPGA